MSTGARRIIGTTLFYLLVLVIVVVALFPFYWILITSLKTDADLTHATDSLLPTSFDAGVYAKLFTQDNFLVPLLNSALVSLCTTVVSLVAGALAAYAMVRLVPRARPAILGFILAVGFFPTIAMAGPLFFIFRSVNFLNSYPALIFSYLIYALPITVWLLVSIFSQIPKDMEEAEKMDGATSLQILWLIMTPLALPGIFTAGILGFILCWNDFLFALSFMTEPSRYTAPLAIVNLGRSQFRVFYNLINAGVVITTLPIVILVLLAQRRIVSGLSAGGLGGG